MSLLKKTLLGAALALLLALVGLAIWTASQFTTHKKEITYPSPEALLNPYLAAEHFLKKQGITFRTRKRLDKALTMPASASGQTLLLLTEQRDAMTRQQTEQLLEWTSWGGHLVVIAVRLWDEKEGKSGDLLLDSLGIEQYLAKDLASEKPSRKKRERFANLTKLYLENETSPAYIGLDTRYHLYDSQDRAHVWANSAGNITHILQLDYGDGLITVLTDPWIWNNDNIGKFDNAWLLWYLTQESEVTLHYQTAPPKPDTPNLLAVLLRYFPEALIALVLLLVFWLWHKGQRYGALLPAAPRARRQLEEHLRASADFLLRRLGRAALIQMLQQDILQHAQERLPSFASVDESAHIKLLAQLSRRPQSQVKSAMQAPSKHPSAADFSRQVKDLQTLRNAL